MPVFEIFENVQGARWKKGNVTVTNFPLFCTEDGKLKIWQDILELLEWLWHRLAKYFVVSSSFTLCPWEVSRVFFGVYLCCKALFQSWWGRKLKKIRTSFCCLGPATTDGADCLRLVHTQQVEGKQPKKPIFSCSGERGFEKLFNETDICGGMDLNRWTNEIYEFQVAWDQYFIQSRNHTSPSLSVSRSQGGFGMETHMTYCGMST